jgi:hypothetical protein
VIRESEVADGIVEALKTTQWSVELELYLKSARADVVATQPDKQTAFVLELRLSNEKEISFSAVAQADSLACQLRQERTTEAKPVLVTRTDPPEPVKEAAGAIGVELEPVKGSSAVEIANEIANILRRLGGP